MRHLTGKHEILAAAEAAGSAFAIIWADQAWMVRSLKEDGFNLSEVVVASGGGQLVAALLDRLPPSLQALALIGQQIGPDGATALATGNLNQLTTLHLALNSIGDDGATALATGNLNQLTTLNLNGNSIGDDGATALATGNLNQLTTLNLYNNSIGADGATALANGNLNQLTTLNLGDNRIGADGATALATGNLNQLTTLTLNANSIGDDGATALATGNLNQLTTLTLYNNSIGADGATALATGNLNQLTTLNLWNNSIGDDGATALATGNLNQLTTLHLRDNSIGDDGATALANGNLNQLTTLTLGDNSIGADGATALATGNLNQLTTLNLWYNRLGEGFEDALASGIESFREHARAEDKEPLWEAKVLFIGEGDVGKSSLLNSLQGRPWDPDRSSTHGLEVSTLNIERDDGVMLSLNAWDFAGQAPYRPTHQIFFTAPAVYLMVWKPRVGSDASHVDEWLQTIRLRTDEPPPPCLVVATHGGPSAHEPELNRASLKTKHGAQVAGFAEVDSKPGAAGNDGHGISELRVTIGELAAALPEMGDKFSQSWTKVRTDLTPTADTSDTVRPYLTFAAFQKIAVEKYGLSPEAATTTCKIAAIRGQWILSGSDKNPQPGDLVVTQPQWLAKAISFVIDDKATKDAGGLLQERRLHEVWDSPHRDTRYDSSLYPTFLKLMERYDLAYRVRQPHTEEQANGPQWLVGQLVSEIPEPGAVTELEPEDALESLRRIVRFARKDDKTPVATPEGLHYRLIVRLHEYGLGARDYRDAIHWRSGLVLEHPSYGHVIIRSDEKQVRLHAWGPQPERMITIVVADIESVLADFWKGTVIFESATCGRNCGIGRPGSGEFDIIKAIEAREKGAEMQCPANGCTTWVTPEEALSGYTPRRSDPDQLDRMEGKIDGISDAVNQTQRAVLRVGEDVIDLGSEVMAGFAQLRKRQPTFIIPALAEVGRLKRTWVKARFRLTLICEHSGRSLADLDGGGSTRGIYEMDLQRSYVKYLGTAFSVLTELTLGFAPGISVGLEGSVDEETFADLEWELEAAEAGIKGLAAGKGIADDVIDLDNPPPALAEMAGRPAEELAIGLLQDSVAAEDPLFGGLVSRTTKDGRVLWVDPQFAGLYPVPEHRRL